MNNTDALLWRPIPLTTHLNTRCKLNLLKSCVPPKFILCVITSSEIETEYTMQCNTDIATMYRALRHYQITVYVLEVDDLLLDNLLFLNSLASFALLARSLAYSAASARDFSPALRLRERRCLFRCRRTGVIRRWILGALYRWGFPSFSGSGLLMTYCRTSSSFVRL